MWGPCLWWSEWQRPKQSARSTRRHPCMTQTTAKWDCETIHPREVKVGPGPAPLPSFAPAQGFLGQPGLLIIALSFVLHFLGRQSRGALLLLSVGHFLLCSNLCSIPTSRQPVCFIFLSFRLRKHFCLYCILLAFLACAGSRAGWGSHVFLFSVDFCSVEASHGPEQFELLGGHPPPTTQSLGATALRVIRHLCTHQL